MARPRRHVAVKPFRICNLTGTSSLAVPTYHADWQPAILEACDVKPVMLNHDTEPHNIVDSLHTVMHATFSAAKI